ncbi:MAG: CRTAC1 family protein [Gemmatimonadota bacterium]
MNRGRGVAAVLCLLSACTAEQGTLQDPDFPPSFESVQPELFSATGAQPNAFIDFDNDGDLDLFVGFRNRPDRLYRNDGGTFTDVAEQVGLASPEDTRVAAWGDYDADGNLDVYIGFPAGSVPDRIYRNDGDGAHFTDVTASLGIHVEGTTRQTSWIDVDRDGDVDLFVALRDGPNRLYRNDAGTFVDITEASGIGDPRRTVGVAWFDFDQDGDLDAFVANQNGDADGFYRNDGGHFADVAAAMGMDGGMRTEEIGGVGPDVTDYDNDGDLDLFVANYGPDALWRNNGDGSFTEVAQGTEMAADHHSTTSAWGDYDNDGWPDLFVAAFLSAEPEAPDHLFRNVGGSFSDVTPALVLRKGASHGVRWADYDQDGDLDLALANNDPEVGTHPLLKNTLPTERAGRSIQVRVLDARGHHTRAGSEVRVYESGTDRLLGARLVDTGGGYCSQGTAPVHLGLPAGIVAVDVEVILLTPQGRVSEWARGVDFRTLPGRVLTVQR